MTTAKKIKDEKTVEEVIMGLPKPEQIIVKKLRALALECMPKATEKVVYNLIPLYRRNRMICYIWPPSIFWGPGRTTESQHAKGVALGFNQGNRMSNEDGALLAEGRKQVYIMYFKKLSDINENQLRALFFEAALVDESFAKKKKIVR